jgi:hypothetical protein
MRPARIHPPVGVVLGVGPDGIGIRGSTPTLSYQELVSGKAPSAGDFIFRGGSLTLHSSGMATVAATSATSAISGIVNRILRTQRATAMRIVSTAVFTRAPAWPGLVASGHSEGAASAEAADSMVVAVASLEATAVVAANG